MDAVADGDVAHGLVVRSDLPIPEWLFGWAAAVVLVVSFVASIPGSPGSAMALYGVDAWIGRGEGFSVYFIFSRLSIFERRDGVVGLRPPLSSLAAFKALPGTVELVAVMIGAVSLDGFGESSAWNSVGGDIA